MKFSERHLAEKDFERWCEIQGAANCASSFLVWLESTPVGKEVLSKLCKGE